MLKLILSVLGGIGLIGGFLYWHFRTLNGFKDEIHKLELRFKDLEKNQELQQQTIGKLSELYPVLNKLFEKLNDKIGK